MDGCSVHPEACCHGRTSGHSGLSCQMRQTGPWAHHCTLPPPQECPCILCGWLAKSSGTRVAFFFFFTQGRSSPATHIIELGAAGSPGGRNARAAPSLSSQPAGLLSSGRRGEVPPGSPLLFLVLLPCSRRAALFTVVTTTPSQGLLAHRRLLPQTAPSGLQPGVLGGLDPELRSE